MELERYDDLLDMPDDEEAIDQSPRPVLEDVRSLKKVTIPTYPLFIGREKRSAICIPLGAVSRRHAKVYEENGVFYIQDLGSINGTFLNGKRILDPVALKEGDRIKIAITTQYAGGVKEYLFRGYVSEEDKKAMQEKRERDMILSELGSDGYITKKILLRNCIFKVSKHNFVSVFKTEESKQVPMSLFDLKKRIIAFFTLLPFKVRDTINLSIEHPKLNEYIKITMRVLSSKQVSSNFGIIEHKCTIVKFPEKLRKEFDQAIQSSELIDYARSRMGFEEGAKN